MKPDNVDHIVYAVPDLDEGIAHIEKLFGIKPEPGGSHMGFGTRNALLALGRQAYFEILAPDPDQKTPQNGRWMGLDTVKEPKIITWAARTDDLEKVLAIARNVDIEIGDHLHMGRTTPKGEKVSWLMTTPLLSPFDGLFPFWLNREKSMSHLQLMPYGGELVSLKAKHPTPREINQLLSDFGIHLEIELANQVEITATIQTSKGIIQLS